MNGRGACGGMDCLFVCLFVGFVGGSGGFFGGGDGDDDDIMGGNVIGVNVIGWLLSGILTVAYWKDEFIWILWRCLSVNNSSSSTRAVSQSVSQSPYTHTLTEHGIIRAYFQRSKLCTLKKHPFLAKSMKKKRNDCSVQFRKKHGVYPPETSSAIRPPIHPVKLHQRCI